MTRRPTALASFLDSHVTVTCVTLTPRETLTRVVSGSKNPPIVGLPIELEQALARLFADEWTALDRADQILIMRDCVEADNGLTSVYDAGELEQYRENIGPGKLARYALVMRVRFRDAR